MNCYLSKPIKGDELIGMVERLGADGDGQPTCATCPPHAEAQSLGLKDQDLRPKSRAPRRKPPASISTRRLEVLRKVQQYGTNQART